MVLGGAADEQDRADAEHDAEPRVAAGRSPMPTPTTIGTMAASTAVTGEMTFIGAVTMSWYMTETPTSPDSAAERPEEQHPPVEVAGERRAAARP